MKKAVSLLLALVMALCLVIPAGAEETAVTGGVKEVQKYGNLVLDIAPAALKEAGFEYGDLLKITVNGKDYDVPLCTNYSDVDTGSLVLRDASDALTLAINMGDFATTNGIAAKETAEDGSFTWNFPEGKTIADVTVSITMGEKGGYHDQYLIHQLTRTDNREDYSSDAVFANFRNVAAGDLGENALFRSSSPVNNELGRASYADTLAQENGVKAVMNLADDNAAIDGYFAAEGFNSPYYQSLFDARKVKALNLGVDFTAADFQSGLAEGLRFFAANEGPYLVHCTEGKDRAGFTSALLECLMGASYDEVVADYMVTYENYYHLTAGSEQYEAVKNSNIVSVLNSITGAEKGADFSKMDLAVAATTYIKAIGLTDEELASLKANLSKDYAAPAEQPETKPTETPAESPVEAPAETPEPAPEEKPAEQPAPAPEVKPEPAPAPMPTVPAAGQTYTVASGDCLWTISQKLYGTGKKWNVIYEANKAQIKNPDDISVGQILSIPA